MGGRQLLELLLVLALRTVVEVADSRYGQTHMHSPVLQNWIGSIGQQVSG